MKKLKSSVAILLGALLVLIAFQNMATVELTFLFWTFETRRIVLIAICVVIGFLLGRIASTHKQPSQGDQ
ncbi:MAG: LapA family protein [Nitrospirota bacterium]|jgi:putative membrane protein|nr:LapA family protein [Nitrospirota bacterium]MDH4359965.1 LapA family protein [Nitrospirota bacterium]MDH5295605.1 LapA family protein [Nitrospirota bacterium]